jgi:hypothetical protein
MQHWVLVQLTITKPTFGVRLRRDVSNRHQWPVGAY